MPGISNSRLAIAMVSLGCRMYFILLKQPRCLFMQIPIVSGSEIKTTTGYVHFLADGSYYFIGSIAAPITGHRESG